MGVIDKIKLLLWKNFLLQKRHKWQTVFEILSPVAFALFLVMTRCIVHPESKPAKSYPPFSAMYFNVNGQDLGNVTIPQNEMKLAFSPDNALTRSVTKAAMKRMASDNVVGLSLALIFNPDLIPEPVGYPNAYLMEKALSKPNAMKNIIVGLEYSDEMINATEWPDDIKVTLRFPAVMRIPMPEHPLKASWRTNLLFPLFPKPGPRAPDDMYGGKTPGYSIEMFLPIQHAVSLEIIKQKSGKEVDTKVYLQRLPQLPYRDDPLLAVLERFVSMIIMLCFAYPFVNTVRSVTTEKELQLKETMTIMGLPYWMHWLAWFMKQFSFLFISVVILTILLKIPFSQTPDGVKFAIMTNTPWTVIMFFLILFVIASLTFSFMISVFFNKANTASSFMGLVWFASYSLFMLTQVLYEDISLTTKLLCSLISTSTMGYAFQMMVLAEGSSRGLQWGDLFSPITYQDPFQPGHVILMFILDAIIYMLIAMYVEKIRPGAYGVPLPWYFPVTKSYWMPEKNKHPEVTTKNGYDHANESLNPAIHDEEPHGVPVGVKIQNLTKVYKGKKKAVDNLNLRMYENEITVLLGHNGAGKTTTISMLTGTVPPSSGTAYINGYDIVTETEQARMSLGICPQHNVLFPDLTVAEHIIFYSKLKGVDSAKIDKEVNHFVKLLELEEKRDVEARHLSGGQKRRLSVGAAMCGSSRVVLLDEPTSGLDPAARRGLWDLLLKEKKGRTMILTTHFMDEADVLGDRIAIMSGGRLQCHGTPYFLKKHYGVGYKITIVKGDQCAVPDITRFIKSYVPEAKENTNIGSELTYILPNHAVSNFPDMLKEFEEKKQSLHVSSYGLSVTSLEEVFMKAGVEENEENRNIANAEQTVVYKDCAVVPIMENKDIIVDSDPIQKVVGFRLLRNHIKAMFLKHAYNSIRNKMTTIVQYASPIINICLSVFISRSWQWMSGLPELNLSLKSGFKMTQTLISDYGNLTDHSTASNVRHAYIDYFKRSNYPGMTIMDINTMDLGKFYLKLSTQNYEKTRFETLVGATFSENNVTGWFSNNGLHDVAISLALVDDAILRSVSPNSSLSIINHPLPYSIENMVRVMATGGSVGFQFAFNIGFTLAFVTSFIVLFVVKERISGAKLLQRVSGLKPIVYWVCGFVWDWIWLLGVYIVIVITLAAFQEDTLKTPEELGRVLFVLVVFSISIIPLHYLASFYFVTPAAGFSKMCFINMFSGSMPFLVIEMLRFLEDDHPYYSKIFDWVFSPLPIYCVSRSFRDMSVASFRLIVCDAMCKEYLDNVNNCTARTVCDQLKISACCIQESSLMDWGEPGIGRYIFMMLLVGVVSFSILLIWEYELFNELMYKNLSVSLPPLALNEDSDVASERRFVSDLPKDELRQQSLVCKDLTKYYNKLLAVNRLTFAVRKAECFGLLGINGAGKTSTFKMLTGDSRISAGDAYVLGLPIKTRLQEVNQYIGYCPQFDALLENLTARETLDIFCLLRGIPERVGAARANQLALALGFRPHFDKKVNACSGGTKRKISTAVALLGDSPLIYLDEPTTGMDPASKRLVWSAISQAVIGGRSIVLTSHSMEECEALCSRLTVMVNGKLFCLGPLQHLKTKFSQGYTLIVKCKPEGRDKTVESVKQYVLDHFVGSRHSDTYLGISTFYLEDAGLPWWRVFHVMQEAVSLFSIEDYSVTQTTLEQVFLRFTRLHGAKDP